jgi:hypothetical protein
MISTLFYASVIVGIAGIAAFLVGIAVYLIDRPDRSAEHASGRHTWGSPFRRRPPPAATPQPLRSASFPPPHARAAARPEHPVQFWARQARIQQAEWRRATAELAHLQRPWSDDTGSFRALVEGGAL